MTDAEAYGGTGHRDGRTLFDAVLHPHRSLGHIGFLVLMLCVSLVSFTGGLIFVAVGAWPVLGFLGANVVLVTIAFKLNYRSGRQMERLRLTLERLEIERISASGRLTRWEFQPYWVQVSLSDAGEQHSRLTPELARSRIDGGKLSQPRRTANPVHRPQQRPGAVSLRPASRLLSIFAMIGR